MSRKVLIGSIGVDSGQVMIGDPCYLTRWVDDGVKWNCPEGGNPNVDCEPTGEFSYSGACNATISEAGHGVLGARVGTSTGLAIASETMFGDGCYPVYAIYERGENRPSRLVVEFDSEDEDY
jgi:hypothetical protein